MQLAEQRSVPGPAGSAIPDFSRNVHCLFGLPFDAVASDAAVDVILDAVTQRRRCVLSTPNLNFMVAAQTDAAFRQSVVHSDLSVVDGMPLVWAGRGLGIPFPERVPGSGLFEKLLRRNAGSRPVKVYLFGGEEGVAAKACAAINAARGGVHCVGYRSPGFGDLDTMSAPDILDAINASGADFLVVSIGAKNGQAWIERNVSRLEPPVVSYLGAVINFMAGTVRRAPSWMQRGGLEWLWRISQERALWKRYWNDGSRALGLVASNILPSLLGYYRQRRRHAADPARVDVLEARTEIVISLQGAWNAASLSALRRVLQTHAGTHKRLRIGMRETTFVESSFVALMILLRCYRLDHGHEWRMEDISPAVARILKMYGAPELYENYARAKPENC